MTSKRSNVSILTSDNKIRAFKKRQKQEQIKEIVFDEHARRYGGSFFSLCIMEIDDFVVLAENILLVFISGIFRRRRLLKLELKRRREWNDWKLERR
jgi:hypothetical protein